MEGRAALWRAHAQRGSACCLALGCTLRCRRSARGRDTAAEVEGLVSKLSGLEHKLSQVWRPCWLVCAYSLPLSMDDAHTDALRPRSPVGSVDVRTLYCNSHHGL